MNAVHLPYFEQAPADFLDYSIDWSKFFPGDPVITSVWSVDDDTLTLSIESLGSSTAVVFVSGGVDEQLYRVTNHVTATSGKQATQSVLIRIKEL